MPEHHAPNAASRAMLARSNMNMNTASMNNRDDGRRCSTRKAIKGQGEADNDKP